MNLVDKVDFILKTLDELYPKVTAPLDHKDNYTLLIAVLLSAQSTDKRVNLITPKLFKYADNPFKMINLSIEKIKEIIKPIGLTNTKSKGIYNLSKILIEKFNGKVPASFEELEKLPSVGHKTASVVMAQAFGVPAFPVDTHIHRLAQRWGLASGKNVVDTEEALKGLFPRESWNRLHLQIIFYGREYCSARGCDGRQCEICQALFPRRRSPVSTRKA